MARFSPSAIFIGKVLVLYVLILECLYPSFIKESIINKALCFFLAKASSMVLALFSFNISLNKTLLGINGIPTLYVATPCSGLDFIFLLGILVFSFPLPSKKKFTGFVLGSMAILTLNIIRLSSLCLIHRFYFSLFEVNHHLIFNVVVYGLMLVFLFHWFKNTQKVSIAKSSITLY